MTNEGEHMSTYDERHGLASALMARTKSQDGKLRPVVINLMGTFTQVELTEVDEITGFLATTDEDDIVALINPDHIIGFAFPDEI